MSDQVFAVTRFERQLRAAGVRATAAIPTVFLYIAALHDRSRAAWEALYRSVHERLTELAASEYPQASGAVEPLLQLLDDDLGSELIPASERARIRALLVEDGRSEASLPP